MYLTFSNEENVNLTDTDIEFNFTYSNGEKINEEEYDKVVSNTSDAVTFSSKSSSIVFQLTSIKINNSSSYTVSNPSLTCVNCSFCLDENSANIFLTRVDFDKEKPEDKKKLFRQYISLPIKTNYSDIGKFKETNENNAIYGISTDGVNATLDNCEIQTHGGEDKFFDCNLAMNKEFKDKGGKDDDHATEFIIYFNAVDKNFTVPTKYELHLVKGEFLSLSFALLFLFLGILF